MYLKKSLIVLLCVVVFGSQFALLSAYGEENNASEENAINQDDVAFLEEPGEIALGESYDASNVSGEVHNEVQASAAGTAVFSIKGTENYVDAQRMLNMINNQRASKGSGLKNLALDADLMEAAMQRAAEIACLFDHSRPDGSNIRTASDKIFGENILAGLSTPESAIDAWMDSTGHRNNILNNSYSTVGIGAFYHNGIMYWVQVFGNSSPAEWSYKSNVQATRQITANTAGYSFGSMKINASSELTVGSTYQCNLSVVNGATSGFTFVPETDTVNWSSSNPDVVEINDSGRLSGIALGTSVIKGELGSCGGASTNISIVPNAPKAPSASYTGWKKEGSSWYYFKGGKAQRGWVSVSGAWYYLSYSNYKMMTGWVSSGGSWYYLNSSGKMAKGWIKNGSWYYLNSSGKMLSGWQKISGAWYYFDSSGAMATGWINAGDWYYLYSSGKMATGWIKSGSSWYYMKASGAMATDWVQVKGKWYFLDESGKWIA